MKQSDSAQKFVRAKLRIALVHSLYGKCPVHLGLLQTNYVKLFFNDPLKIIALLLIFLVPNLAHAHKVIIFAWVENGMIYSESSFGSKRKALNSKIIVEDESGIIIHEGITDTNGDYAFKIPENADSDLILKLEAGTGHKGSWKISKEELKILPGQTDIESTMKEKEILQKSPSLLKILSGIGIIFLIAFGLKILKRKKTND